MRRIIFLMVVISTLTAGTAFAESIDGRLGITGKLGGFVPIQSDFVSGASDSKSGIAAGGGFIYGLDKNLALELEVTQVPTIDIEAGGVKVGEAAVTDFSLGLQYRFTQEKRLVPYLGAGIDFITGDFKNKFDQKYDFDWSVGGHVSAGVDYFATKGVVLTAELKGIIAGKGDIKTTPLEYDPTSFVGTVGLRLFLPEKILE